MKEKWLRFLDMDLHVEYQETETPEGTITVEVLKLEISIENSPYVNFMPQFVELSETFYKYCEITLFDLLTEKL